MQKKFIELTKKIDSNRFVLKEESKAKKYLFNLPIDYGGLGDYQENRERINYFDVNARKSNPPQIEIKYFPFVPLETNSEYNELLKGSFMYPSVYPGYDYGVMYKDKASSENGSVKRSRSKRRSKRDEEREEKRRRRKDRDDSRERRNKRMLLVYV